MKLWLSTIFAKKPCFMVARDHDRWSFIRCLWHRFFISSLFTRATYIDYICYNFRPFGNIRKDWHSLQKYVTAWMLCSNCIVVANPGVSGNFTPLFNCRTMIRRQIERRIFPLSGSDNSLASDNTCLGSELHAMYVCTRIYASLFVVFLWHNHKADSTHDIKRKST